MEQTEKIKKLLSELREATGGVFFAVADDGTSIHVSFSKDDSDEMEKLVHNLAGLAENQGELTNKIASLFAPFVGALPCEDFHAVLELLATLHANIYHAEQMEADKAEEVDEEIDENLPPGLQKLAEKLGFTA